MALLLFLSAQNTLNTIRLSLLSSMEEGVHTAAKHTQSIHGIFAVGRGRKLAGGLCHYFDL